MSSFRLLCSITLASFSLVGCDDGSGDFDMELVSLSRTNVVIKSTNNALISDCVVLINGAGGFWYEPERVAFKKGQSRSFVLSRFFTSTKRQFNYQVDSITKIAVNCKQPSGTAVVFETNESFGGFLK